LWGLRVREGERRTEVGSAGSDDLAFAVALAAWGATQEERELAGKRRLL
jgi:hypothetical protein